MHQQNLGSLPKSGLINCLVLPYSMITLDGVGMSDIVKICVNCGDLKIDQVYLSKKSMQCKACHKRIHDRNRLKNTARINEFIRIDRKINPEKYAARQRKYQKKYRDLITSKTIIRNFNITIEEYKKMFVDQDHKCFICKKIETKISTKSGKVNRLSLDHCHRTNKVRKLLCHNCNIMIGAAKESIEILQEAISYLKGFEDDKQNSE
jgi:hypothetical protein